MTDLLTGDESHAIILALARGHGDKGFTEADAKKCIDALTGWKVSGSMFHLVVEGEINLVIRGDGEVACTRRIR